MCARLTEYVTIVVLLGATVVAFPDAELALDADPVTDAVFEDDPEDGPCDADGLAVWEADGDDDGSWAYVKLASTIKSARTVEW